MQLLDVLGIDEDLAVDGLELVGAGSEHFCDDVWSLPQWRELVVVLVALDEAEHQVPDDEGLTPHSTAVVPAQHLLVLGQAEEGNVARFIQLVHGVLEGCLGSLFIVRPDPWRSIVEVGQEDSLGTIDHEEWCVVGGPAGCHPQAPEHRRELYDPSSTKLVQLVEDPRLEAL